MRLTILIILLILTGGFLLIYQRYGYAEVFDYAEFDYEEWERNQTTPIPTYEETASNPFDFSLEYYLPDTITGIGESVTQEQAQKNIAAFLWMIRRAEHKGLNPADDYRRLYGGSLFNSFADHPRVIVNAGGYSSSAAGAYQFLSSTWDDVVERIGATDFSPHWQDQGAIDRLKYRGAYNDVRAGRFEAAISKVNKEWASLPGSPYGQPVLSMAEVKSTYQQSGGVFA